MAFNGLGMGLGNLSLLSAAKSRSISPENLSGEPGSGGMATDGPAARAARDLGRGWKVSPYRVVEPGATLVLADIAGPGAIQHIWLTLTGHWRFSILRIYWDGQDAPSVEGPAGDFFACGWNTFAQVSSLPVCVNPGRAFNCYWEMPFRKGCRITIENISEEQLTLYWQVDYTLTDVPAESAYFHAQFRRVNPLPYKEVVAVLYGVEGPGQYVGTYLAWGVNSTGWWGEGEVKFYLDGDREFPTICGTGTEDYFCGSPFRPSVGVAAAATCRSGTTSLQPCSGTRRSPPRRSRSCRGATSLKSHEDGQHCFVESSSSLPGGQQITLRLVNPSDAAAIRYRPHGARAASRAIIIAEIASKGLT